MHEIPLKSWMVAAAVLRVREDGPQVLLLRRQGTTLSGEWCWVAGRIRQGEPAWRAALRETREETGLVPDRFYSADVCEQYYDVQRECISVVPVFVAFLDGEQQVTLNHEHSQYAWLDFPEALRRVPFVGQAHALQQIHRQFIDREPSRWLQIYPSPPSSPKKGEPPLF